MVAATTYKSVSNNNGVVAFRLDTARIRVGYDRIIHEIDVKMILNNLNYIEHLSRMYEITDHLEETLSEKIRIAREKIHNLYPKRDKRALINALGSIIKYVAGNPDDEDLQLIQTSLEALQNHENKITQNMNKQIKINEILQDRINKISATIKKINSNLSAMRNSTQKIKIDLELVNLIFNTDMIIKILEDIEEQIVFSKNNLLNKNLLSQEEKKLIFNKLRSSQLDLSIIDDIFQYISSSLTISGTRILLMVKIPVLDDKVYDLIGLETVDINGSAVDTNVKIVAKYHDNIFSQSSKCSICENSTPIQDECIFNLLTHQTPKCQLTNRRQSTRVKELKKGIILVDTSKNVLVTDSCGHKRIINEPTIIEVDNCTVHLLNYTFNNDKSMIFAEEYLAPIYGKAMQIINRTETIETISPVHLQNLDELERVQISLHRTQTTMFWGSCALFLLIIIYTLLRCLLYRRIRNKSEATTQHTWILPAVQKTEVTKDVESDNNTQKRAIHRKKKPMQLPRFALYRSHPRTADTPRGEALRHELPPHDHPGNVTSIGVPHEGTRWPSI